MTLCVCVCVCLSVWLAGWLCVRACVHTRVSLCTALFVVPEYRLSRPAQGDSSSTSPRTRTTGS